MKKSFVALTLLSILASPWALAKNSKMINETIDVEPGQPISFTVPVGSLKIKTCNCNEISLSVKVEASNSWNIFNDKDMADASLKIDNNSHSLALRVDKKDSKQQWTVTLPASSALEIEMGVGEVNIAQFSNNLDAELGVGNIEVAVAKEHFDSIKLEAGVGETSVAGFKQHAQTKRAMVSSTTQYRGEGQYAINIEVGVGNAGISLN